MCWGSEMLSNLPKACSGELVKLNRAGIETWMIPKPDPYHLRIIIIEAVEGRNLLTKMKEKCRVGWFYRKGVGHKSVIRTLC